MDMSLKKIIRSDVYFSIRLLVALFSGAATTAQLLNCAPFLCSPLKNKLPAIFGIWMDFSQSQRCRPSPNKLRTLSMLHYSATLNPKTFSSICNYKIKEGPTDVADWRKKTTTWIRCTGKKKWHFTDTLSALMMSLSTLLRTHSL